MPKLAKFLISFPLYLGMGGLATGQSTSENKILMHSYGTSATGDSDLMLIDAPPGLEPRVNRLFNTMNARIDIKGVCIPGSQPNAKENPY